MASSEPGYFVFIQRTNSQTREKIEFAYTFNFLDPPGTSADETSVLVEKETSHQIIKRINKLAVRKTVIRW